MTIYNILISLYNLPGFTYETILIPNWIHKDFIWFFPLIPTIFCYLFHIHPLISVTSNSSIYILDYLISLVRNQFFPLNTLNIFQQINWIKVGILSLYFNYKYNLPIFLCQSKRIRFQNYSNFSLIKDWKIERNPTHIFALKIILCHEKF